MIFVWKYKYENFILQMVNSKDLELLENTLRSLKIYKLDVFDFEQCYYCSVCFDGSSPGEEGLLEKGNNDDEYNAQTYYTGQQN